MGGKMKIWGVFKWEEKPAGNHATFTLLGFVPMCGCSDSEIKSNFTNGRFSEIMCLPSD